MASVFGDDGHLPDRSVLLHIGPHKTGTTAIQGSLAAARPALAKHGCLYPGENRQHQLSALAAVARSGPAGLPTPRYKDWKRLARQVRAAGLEQRVVLSGEAFSEADDERARRIVKQLGGDNVHVVITLRPLVKILPSQWQQYVRNRMRRTYEEWLHTVLDAPEKSAGTFWHRHRHDELARRWLSIVGPDRLAVVVASDTDRGALLRGFESLLDLPANLLVPEETSDNRGLTAQEIELIRQLNVVFHDRHWPWKLYHRIVRRGAVRRMQQRTPGPDEPRIHTPQWAVERANQLAAEAAAGIRELGVTVLGDLDSLSSVRADPLPDLPSDVEAWLPESAAREAIAGAQEALARLRAKRFAAEQLPLDAVTTPELVGIVWRRLAARARS